MAVGFVDQVKKMIRTRDSLATLLVGWVVCVVVPFSIVETRVPRYILPAFPAFAILAAVPIHRWLERIVEPRRVRAAYSAVAAVVLLVAMLANPRYRAEDVTSLAPLVDKYTKPGEQVVFYAFEGKGYSYHNQLLWYSNRFYDYVDDQSRLKEKLLSPHVFVVDKISYNQLVFNSGIAVERLGESNLFLLFRTI